MLRKTIGFLAALALCIPFHLTAFAQDAGRSTAEVKEPIHIFQWLGSLLQGEKDSNPPPSNADGDDGDRGSSTDPNG